MFYEPTKKIRNRLTTWYANPAGAHKTKNQRKSLLRCCGDIAAKAVVHRAGHVHRRISVADQYCKIFASPDRFPDWPLPLTALLPVAPVNDLNLAVLGFIFFNAQRRKMLHLRVERAVVALCDIGHFIQHFLLEPDTSLDFVSCHY